MDYHKKALNRNSCFSNQFLWISTLYYVCIEWIFNRPLFMCNRIFFKKLQWKLVVHVFTLLLAPFTSKSVEFLRHSETVNFRKDSKLANFLSKTTNWPFPNIFLRLAVTRIIDQLSVLNFKNSHKLRRY